MYGEADSISKKRSDQDPYTYFEKPNSSYLIIQYLSNIDRPVGAPEIASSLKMMPHSVRARLSELRKEGIVFKPYYGKYSITPRYGLEMIGRLPRVQNLRGSADSSIPVVVHDDVVVVAGDVQISVTFGMKRNRVSFVVRAPLGLDLYGLDLVLFTIERICQDRGFMGLQWYVTNWEILNDVGGLRLDGVEAITFRDFRGSFEKFYNRSGLRREIRGSRHRKMSMAQLQAFMEGGLARFDVVRALEDIVREIEGVKEAQKGTNRFINNMAQLNQAILETLTRMHETRV